jgi:hypothetical protein
MEEIADNTFIRKTTVTCTMNNSVVLFIKRVDFVNAVNNYKLSDRILQERILKQKMFNLHHNESKQTRQKAITKLTTKNTFDSFFSIMQLNKLNVNQEFTQKNF